MEPSLSDEQILRQSIASIHSHFTPLTEACVVDLAKAATTLRLQKGEVFVREGQFATDVYFVLNGCARAYYLKDGKDITDWFVFENDFIIAINSFYQGIPSPHFIEVLEESILISIPKTEVNKLTEKYRAFDRLEKIAVTQTMLALQQRMVSIQFETAYQRYQNLLTVHPAITQRVPLKHIASYLGITLETLSRVRSQKTI